MALFCMQLMISKERGSMRVRASTEEVNAEEAGIVISGFVRGVSRILC